MNFEGCRCPWCGYVTVVLLEQYDNWVVGTCNECGNTYKAIPHPVYPTGVKMMKFPEQHKREIKNEMAYQS